MRIIKIAALAVTTITLLASIASADPTIKVTFPEKGGYLYWIDYYKTAVGKSELMAPKHVAGESAEIDLGSVAPGLVVGSLRIYDPKTGNVAVKKLSTPLEKKEIKLKDADFDLVHTVKITLKPAESKNPDERLESGIVRLKDANSDEHIAVIDPDSEGTAVFHDVAGGQETITAAYDGGKMTVDLEIPLERDEQVFSHTLAISADVRTIKVSSKTDESAKEANNSDEKSAKKDAKNTKVSPATAIVSTIAGLLFLVLIGFVAFVALKSKGATIEGGLKKLGVQMPGEDGLDQQGMLQSNTPQAPPVDPNVCQFCGQMKNPTTGTCACSVSPASMGGSVASGLPKLIGTMGSYANHIFDLTSSDMTIGRDAGNPIALTQDGAASRRHARFSKEGSNVFITDEGSSNGTYVNGMKLTGRQQLQIGDEIQIGNSKFRFEA